MFRTAIYRTISVCVGLVFLNVCIVKASRPVIPSARSAEFPTSQRLQAEPSHLMPDTFQRSSDAYTLDQRTLGNRKYSHVTSIAIDEQQWRSLSVGDVLAKGAFQDGKCEFGLVKYSYPASKASNRYLAFSFDVHKCVVVASERKETPKNVQYRPLLARSPNASGRVSLKSIRNFNPSIGMLRRTSWSYGNSGLEYVIASYGAWDYGEVQATLAYSYDTGLDEAYISAIDGDCYAYHGWNVDTCTPAISDNVGDLDGMFETNNFQYFFEIQLNYHVAGSGYWDCHGQVGNSNYVTFAMYTNCPFDPQPPQ